MDNGLYGKNNPLSSGNNCGWPITMMPKNLKLPFEQASYLGQVRRLRCLAEETLKQYPFTIRNIEFIKYSANAIFKITDKQNKQYVLRINPTNHHQHPAILEEIKWINHILAKTDLIVPKPVKSLGDQFLTEIHHPLISSSRNCLVFEWLPGKKKWRSINESYAKSLGLLIAKLHLSGQSVSMNHRKYWLTDGLIGTDKAKFYNIEQLSDISVEDQKYITSARRMLYDILKEQELKHPDKIGVIHSDTQPNNIVVHQGQFSIIDFDDCGLGFYLDDLAVALCALEHVTEGNQNKSFLQLKDALLAGYNEYIPLSGEDIKLLPYFMLTRKLVTIAWLEARKSNPGIRYYYPIAINRAIEFYKQILLQE